MASLNAIAPIGIVLGATLGLGLWLVVSAVPRVGRPRLVERVAPYVADFSTEARAMLARRPADPGPVLAASRPGKGQWLCFGGMRVRESLRE